MVTEIVTPSVIPEKPNVEGERPAIERIREGENIPFSEVEKQYKKRGGTILHAIFGADPFDFWIGRFYVGTFGAVSLVGIFFGVVFYLYQAWVVEGTYNLLRARIDPPPLVTDSALLLLENLVSSGS